MLPCIVVNFHSGATCAGERHLPPGLSRSVAPLNGHRGFDVLWHEEGGDSKVWRLNVPESKGKAK